MERSEWVVVIGSGIGGAALAIRRQRNKPAGMKS
jgi:2-polyprenyl-6-methoxyphenol hydroxylase-like FAD-dependent oxidoreductase